MVVYPFDLRTTLWYKSSFIVVIFFSIGFTFDFKDSLTTNRFTNGRYFNKGLSPFLSKERLDNQHPWPFAIHGHWDHLMPL